VFDSKSKLIELFIAMTEFNKLACSVLAFPSIPQVEDLSITLTFDVVVAMQVH
jgi:hypothetical protein